MKCAKTSSSSVLLLTTSFVGTAPRSMSGALAAVDVRDLSGHERYRLDVEDSTDHILTTQEWRTAKFRPRSQLAADFDGTLLTVVEPRILVCCGTGAYNPRMRYANDRPLRQLLRA